ncbi:MAG: LuxR C-terminal-related transcriptional regulator [Sphingobium sp.]
MSARIHVGGPVLTAHAMRHLPGVIDGIGENGFDLRLMELLSVACGARHCTLFQRTGQSLTPVLAVSLDGTDLAHRQFALYLGDAYWRGDSFLASTMQAIGADGYSLDHIDTAAMPDAALREHIYDVTHIGQRLLLCWRSADVEMGLSMLRADEQGSITPEQLSCMTALSGTLVSLLDKHLAWAAAPDTSRALTSLPDIEGTLRRSDVPLPRREVQVCARILYGISTTGIALDLGIAEETVMTYRKRVYQRLSVGCQRELLIWYLRQWSSRRAPRPTHLLN